MSDFVQIHDPVTKLGQHRTAGIDTVNELFVAPYGNVTQVTGSTNGAGATAITATLTATATKTAYITGFMVTGSGATGASAMRAPRPPTIGRVRP